MKRYIRSTTTLNEDEQEYLIAKILKVLGKRFPDYDVDDVNRQGNRIGFGLYDAYGGEHGHYVFVYRPDYDGGPEEQLDEWLDDTFG